ncbi:MAG: hypothetical protein B6D56_02115 [Candidatus Omnitrophica bacterium 4484_70.1]|nr:MAG: hypothetical protein B6D56_02115 [Candidatus Omnitrophica bacterium 4484_70.1]
MIVFFVILILLYSIVIHEVAHGWMAYRLGDSTPKLAGRLTLNPFAHIDIVGTIILPILLLIISRGNFSLGFAKPVPINPYNFKNPKRDIMWVGMAGPLSNLILAFLFLFLLKIKTISALYTIFAYGALINLILALFNLLPIPPLDGSKIISSFLNYRRAYFYLKSEIWGIILIILLISTGFLRWFIFPIIKFIFHLAGVEIETLL